MAEFIPENIAPPIRIHREIRLTGEAIDQMREEKQLQHLGESCLMPIPTVSFMGKLIDIEHIKFMSHGKSSQAAVRRVESLTEQYTNANKETQSKMLAHITKEHDMLKRGTKRAP